MRKNNVKYYSRQFGGKNLTLVESSKIKREGKVKNIYTLQKKGTKGADMDQVETEQEEARKDMLIFTELAPEVSILHGFLENTPSA